MIPSGLKDSPSDLPGTLEYVPGTLATPATGRNRWRSGHRAQYAISGNVGDP